MLFDFLPWKIEVDLEKTKQFYIENDYSVNKEWNQNFSKCLNANQRAFFDTLNVDLMNVVVDRHDFEDNEEVPYMLSIHFFVCGKMLSMPEQQLELYMDEEVFGAIVNKDEIEPIETDDLITYDALNLGTGIRFKHPAVLFEDEKFQKWDCGVVCGSLIVRG